MSVVKVNTQEAPQIFEQDSFEPIPSGVYIVSIGNLPGSNAAPDKIFGTQTAKSSGNAIVPVQLRIEGDENGGETPYQGRLLFENFVLSYDFGVKRLVHFALCMGAMTEDEIKAEGGVELERFTADLRGKVEITRKASLVNGESRIDNKVQRFLFEK